MADDLIRYDVLAQEALRGVVRRVLIEAGKDGLPGEHHFFIAFDTRHPGVRISDRLREKHPEEMTIVLQHQFWDLNVTEQTFEVGLSFGNVPERLLVPFEALKGFFDPSVQFGLQFDVQRSGDPQAAKGTGGEITSLPAVSQPRAVAPLAPPKAPDEGVPKAADEGAEETARPAADGDDETNEPGGQVVSLDAFRKKN